MKPSTPAAQHDNRAEQRSALPKRSQVEAHTERQHVTFVSVFADLAFAVLHDVVVVAHQHKRHRQSLLTRFLRSGEHVVERDALVHTDLVGFLDRWTIGLRIRVRDAQLNDVRASALKRQEDLDGVGFGLEPTRRERDERRSVVRLGFLEGLIDGFSRKKEIAQSTR